MELGVYPELPQVAPSQEELSLSYSVPIRCFRPISMERYVEKRAGSSPSDKVWLEVLSNIRRALHKLKISPPSRRPELN